MSSSIRRGTLAATALALAVTTLSACGAGNDAETLEIKPDNAATSVGSVKIQNVNIVTPDSGSGPSAVTARIFNQGKKDETLTAITVKGAGGRVKLSPTEGEEKLTVPAGGSLALGGKGNASAELPESGTSKVRDGNAQPVSFDLSRTGKVTLRATVVPAHGDYKRFGPSAEPSPGAPSGSPSATPSGREGNPSEEEPEEAGEGAEGDETGEGGEAAAGNGAGHEGVEESGASAEGHGAGH